MPMEPVWRLRFDVSKYNATALQKMSDFSSEKEDFFIEGFSHVENTAKPVFLKPFEVYHSICLLPAS